MWVCLHEDQPLPARDVWHRKGYLVGHVCVSTGATHDIASDSQFLRVWVAQDEASTKVSRLGVCVQRHV